MKRLSYYAFVGILSLAFSFSLTACKGSKHRRKSYYKKHKKHKKFKNKKHWKAFAPDISTEEAIKSAEGIGKRLYKAAFKADFVKLKGIILKESDAARFAKKELTSEVASITKMKEKFSQWKNHFQNARFKKVKSSTSEQLTIKPGAAPKDKYKEIADSIKEEIVIQPAKVFGKKQHLVEQKCAYLAIQLKDKTWRLLRIKSCKRAD